MDCFPWYRLDSFSDRMRMDHRQDGRLSGSVFIRIDRFSRCVDFADTCSSRNGRKPTRLKPQRWRNHFGRHAKPAENQGNRIWKKTMAESHLVREQTQWALRCPGTGSPFPRWSLRWVVMTIAVTLRRKPGEPHLEKNDGGIPPRPGTNTMGMRCPGTGSPFPRWSLRWVVMTNAVTLRRKPGEPHLEKNDGGIPPRPGTNTMGMRCPGTGSPFPRWALRWVVMTNAITLRRKPGEPHLEKKRWRNPTPSGNKHNGHALSGHGFPFPKVVVAVGRHDKCGHPAQKTRGTAFGKKRWRNPTPSGNKHNGHALSGHGFPFPKVGVAVGRHDNCGHPAQKTELS